MWALLSLSNIFYVSVVSTGLCLCVFNDCIVFWDRAAADISYQNVQNIILLDEKMVGGGGGGGGGDFHFSIFRYCCDPETLNQEIRRV